MMLANIAAVVEQRLPSDLVPLLGGGLGVFIYSRKILRDCTRFITSRASSSCMRGGSLAKLRKALPNTNCRRGFANREGV